MKKNNKKPYVIILVILSLILMFQLVLVVDYYSDSFKLSFSKSSDTIATYETYEDIIYTKYFSPFQIIVKDYDKNVWEISSNNEILHEKIWSDVKILLSKTLTKVPVKKYELTAWNDFYSLPGVMIDFNGPIELDFIGAALKINAYTSSYSEIEKITFVPNEDNSVTVYVKSSEACYEYSNILASEIVLGTDFTTLISELNSNIIYENNKKIFIYTIIGNEYAMKDSLEQDIIIPVIEERNRIMNTIEIKPMSMIYDYGIYKSNGESETNESIIKEAIFGQYMDRYETKSDSENTLFFINDYNIYQFAVNGNVKYNYSEGNEGIEKGSVEEAFINSVDMINSLFNANGGNSNELYVSSVIVKDNIYEFQFDYKHFNFPIVIDGSEAAITIEANATRVISLDGAFIDIQRVKINNEELVLEYDTDFIRNITYVDKQLLGLNAREAYIGYVRDEAILQFYKPCWIIERYDGEIDFFELKGAE